jgi:hypothetical protein
VASRFGNAFVGFGGEVFALCVALRCFTFARFAFAVAVFATPSSMR